MISDVSDECTTYQQGGRDYTLAFDAQRSEGIADDAQGSELTARPLALVV